MGLRLLSVFEERREKEDEYTDQQKETDRLNRLNRLNRHQFANYSYVVNVEVGLEHGWRATGYAPLAKLQF